ncbi:PsiF family protein [Noviherbaspirillum sp. 1P10PC]|uniref:PsiF family protein n=1 Tax=Noviherbaspirillum sp. 1P10PC TaxID=3132292 RepID=UPI0039A23A97
MNKLIIMLAAAMLAGPAVSADRVGQPSKTEAAPLDAPRDTSRECNQQAKDKGLKGEQRKTFLNSCMKNVGNATAAPQSLGDPSKPALQTSKP